jgi:type VI secretion system protein ImpH
MAPESGNEGVVVEEAGLEAQPAALLSNAPRNALMKMLEEEPFRVHFFQAVRLLQRLDKERAPVGHFSKPQEETLRFSSLPSLSFPPSELYDLEKMPTGQLKMTVQFMGLCAALSALPAMYTEMVLTRIREKDRAMADFFDIFDHRLLSLFYRSWEKHHFYVGYEAGQEDKLTLRLLDVLGLGTEGLRGRSLILDETCVYYAGLLGRHVRTATGLRQILEDFFDVSVHVHQFAGTWRPLPRENQTFLSGFGTVSEQLGLGVVAGEEVWDHHGRIRVTFGPLTFGQYEDFLPGESAHRELAAFMKFYSDGAYETEVQLILRREDVPACGLGRRGEPPRLGLVSWLKTKPRTYDADEAMFLLPG